MLVSLKGLCHVLNVWPRHWAGIRISGIKHRDDLFVTGYERTADCLIAGQRQVIASGRICDQYHKVRAFARWAKYRRGAIEKQRFPLIRPKIDAGTIIANHHGFFEKWSLLRYIKTHLRVHENQRLSRYLIRVLSTRVIYRIAGRVDVWHF